MKRLIIILLFPIIASGAVFINSFNSGQLSLKMKYRVDTDKRSMGVETLENMLVQPEGPIFRRTGTEFIDEALTEFSYTVTDTNDSNDPNTPVYGDYTEFFLGYNFTAYGNILEKCSMDGTVDTSWGVNGYFGSQVKDYVGNNALFDCRDILQLADGRLLIVHNTFWVDGGDYTTGNLAACTMLLDDGNIDTTWGYNGHYILENSTEQRPMGTPLKIFECADGTFILIGASNTGSPYNLHKINSDGSRAFAVPWTNGYNCFFLPTPTGACWLDDEKTTLIVTGLKNQSTLPGYNANIVAIKASTLDVDTSWGHLGAHDVGWVHIDVSATTQCYSIVKLSDGLAVLHSPDSTSYYTISKITLDGTAYDTTFGVDGHSGADVCPTASYTWPYNSFVFDGTNLFVLGNKNVLGVADGDCQRIEKFDLSGTSSLSLEFQSVPSGNDSVYHNMNLINNKLFIMTKDQYGAINDLEVYNKSFELIENYELGEMVLKNIVIPDEETREVTYTGGGDGETTTTTTIFATSDKTRLIPFQFSVSDAYVLEFGNKFVSFLRTQ